MSFKMKNETHDSKRRTTRGKEMENWGFNLGLGENRGIEKIWVETDSAIAVKLIRDGYPPTHPCKPLLAAIINLMEGSWEVILTHTYKEANTVADSLANSAFNYHYGIHILDNPPREILDLFKADVTGIEARSDHFNICSPARLKQRSATPKAFLNNRSSSSQVRTIVFSFVSASCCFDGVAVEGLTERMCPMPKRRGASSRGIETGGSVRGEPVESVGPTASARQRKRSQHVEQHVEQEVEIPPTEEAGYKGGPRDTTLLRSYESHVAQRLWTGEDRGALKVVTHGRKLKRPEDDYIQDIIDDSGLGPLIEGTHSMVDMSLLSAFTERWHRGTSSFHLLVGEMTITLDDVSTLLHLPVTGRLFSLPALSREDAKALLVSALKVSHAEATTETEITRGAYVRLSWLRDVYKSNIESRNLNAAARAYLLHLVGCTIFADKSATTVRVTYLELFRDLRNVGKIAWGAAALAYLYEQLKDASCHKHPSAWILEHFPHIMHIEKSPDYVEGMPLCMRLRPHRPVGDVVSVRQYLDRIRHEDIIWIPYVSYRPYRPFHDIYWYYGYISCGSSSFPHLPDHVLRQYGHIQGIPPSPHDQLPVPPMTDIHDHYLHYEDHLLDAGRRGPVATHAGECIHGYLDWFRTVSHPYIIPHQERVHEPLPPTLPVYREEGTSTGTQNSTAHEVLVEGISQRMQALLRTDMCTSGSDGERLTQEAFEHGTYGHAEPLH
ncbi:Ribonuclease H domain [Sesbania bispinosa]|nr:Ribonuclease H domain [Sesbania bispinosa]